MTKIVNKYNSLGTLQDRVSSVSNVIVKLLEEGYIPNANKHTTINFASILIDCYENIEIMTGEQEKKLNNLFNLIVN